MDLYNLRKKYILEQEERFLCTYVIYCIYKFVYIYRKPLCRIQCRIIDETLQDKNLNEYLNRLRRKQQPGVN